jgi:hypothetical protein
MSIGIRYTAWQLGGRAARDIRLICFRTCSTSIRVEMAPIWAFCAPFD